MVNILAFPGKPSSKATHQDSLECGAEMPLVASTLDGTLVVARNASPGPSGDWNNQELADLYRVEALLVQAGIRITTGRGLSDENEPWFVFCRDDGEVFVHLARTGGVYLLDSPGLEIPLEGSDFASLIDLFVKKVAARSEPENNNVVRFRPRMLHDRTIRLHPAVMLAALVWTLYLSSDDLVGTAEAADNLASVGGNIPHAMMDHSLDGAVPGLDADFAPGFWPAAEEQVTPQGGSAQTLGPSDRQLASSQEGLRTQQGLEGRGLSGTFSGAVITPQAVAASLAVIALGYGLHDAHSLTNLTSTDDAEKAVAALHLMLNQDAEATPSQVVTQADGSPIAVAQADGSPIAVAQADGSPIEVAIVMGDKIETPDTVANAPMSAHALLSATLEALPAPAIEPGRPEVSAVVQAVDPVSTAGAGQAVPLVTEDKVAAVTHEVTTMTSTVTLVNAQSVISFVSDQLGALNQYQVGDITISATLDQDNLDKVMLQLGDVTSETYFSAGEDDLPVSTPDLSGAEEQDDLILSTSSASYDDLAKKFVHDFILDAGSIEMLQTDSELLLVDITAIDEPADHAFVRSWITDDGYTISTVGHFQTFLDYGLA